MGREVLVRLCDAERPEEKEYVETTDLIVHRHDLIRLRLLQYHIFENF